MGKYVELYGHGTIWKNIWKYIYIYGNIQHKGKYRWNSLLIYYTDSRDFPIKKKTQKTAVSNKVLLVKIEPVTDTIPSSLTCWIIRASLNTLEIDHPPSHGNLRHLYPLVIEHSELENHHAIHGTTHYFDWAIFHS